MAQAAKMFKPESHLKEEKDKRISHASKIDLESSELNSCEYFDQTPVIKGVKVKHSHD